MVTEWSECLRARRRSIPDGGTGFLSDCLSGMFLGRMEPRKLAQYFSQPSVCRLQPRTGPCGGDSVLSGRSCVFFMRGLCDDSAMIV
jgi:hypothetical protein